MSNRSPGLLSILLIEDNAGDRRLAEIALQESARDAHIRCQTQSASSLAEGLVMLDSEAGKPDAVLLDLGLPDATGLEGLRALSEANPDIPIIVLTGLSDLKTATEALKQGANDFLEKNDIRPHTLLRAIRYAIERKKNEAELVRLAQTDPLTGLLNRRAFFERLEQTTNQTRRSDQACAVIFFDINDFKQFNDLFGHKMGDDLLITVTHEIQTLLRKSDILARMGGDEFAIVATNLKSADGALELAEKIVARVTSISEVNGVHLQVSCSVGISVFPADNSEAELLLSHADMAMYKSKAIKSKPIHFFDMAMDQKIKTRRQLKWRMQSDISDGRFFLHFQPIVSANRDAIFAVEALARWNELEGNTISPTEFIPIAEEAGLIASLGSRLLDDAITYYVQSHRDQFPRVPILLNVSAIQCRAPEFASDFLTIVEKRGVSPNSFGIEITESTIMNNADVIKKNLALLKQEGIKICMDDFGTGYSSLSALRDLPIDVLKIDRSFVYDIGQNNSSEVIAKLIIELAKGMGLETIAEGVETEEQASFLRNMGVDYLQGYLFARPMSGEQLTDWRKGAASRNVISAA